MATDDSIKVTVVVPTHNTSALVVRNIKSLAGQTMPATDFEVIYVDDGSDDGTDELVARSIAGLPHFSLIRSANSGWPGRPRNLGIEAARGDYIFFSDDDDWLEPDALEHLHARAVADDADIVIGRIAGHGRGSHRGVQASMTGGDIRRPEDSILLRSMTVHKLMRRAFLNENGLRFDEGKVRLEDHIFMLQAYLRTSRVSIMHDRTIYHWVRNASGGNHSFGAVDPEAYTSSISRIFAIINDRIDDPATRKRFVLNWYQRKVLKHAPQAHFLKGSAEYAEALVAANRSLIEKWVPPDYDTRLSHLLRVRAALLRAGATETLRAWGAYERGITVRTNLRSCAWRDGGLVIAFAVEMVDGDQRPIVFRHVADRVMRELPAPYDGMPGTAKVCDVTDEIRLAHARVLIRNRQPSGDVMLDVDSSTAETPLDDGRFTLRFEVETSIDPMTADKGHPITGIWDVFATLDLCGHGASRRLSAADNLGVGLSKQRLADGTVARPVLTSYGDLSLRVGRPGTAKAPGGADVVGPASLARKVRGGARKVRVLCRRALRQAAGWRRRAG